MKKYLMTGVAAIAISAAFTSCSKDADVYNANYQKEKTQLTYNEAFLNYVDGYISPTQDWGFGTNAKASTRAAEGYVATTNATLFSEDWSDDKNYVTAVEGQTPLYHVSYTVDATNYPLSDKPEVLKKYMEVLPENQDNRSKIASTNKQEFVTTEAGPITYTVLPGITAGKDKVGYYYYDTKCNIKTIHKYVLTNDIYNTKLSSYDNLSYNYEPNGQYICTYSGCNYKTFSLIYVDENGNESTTFPAGINVGFFVENSNLVQGTAVEMYSKGSLNSQISGWLHTNTNGTTWAGKTFENTATESHVAIFSYEGHNYVGFEDWVDYDYNDVVLSVEGNIEPAKEVKNEDPTPKEEVTEHNYSIRVIGEDLTFGEDVDADFDFNDVVFDVALESNSTWIKLKAAGGTLPLIIGVANPQDDQDYNDHEVHHLFGLTDTGVMINTNASAKNLRGADLDDVEFELTTAYSNAKEIPVYVKKNGQWVELKAVQGEPASKIGVGTDFIWCDEQVSLKKEHVLFVQWVQGKVGSTVKWY